MATLVNFQIHPQYNVQLYVYDLTRCPEVIGSIPRTVASLHSFFTRGSSVIPHTSIVVNKNEYSYGANGYTCNKIGPEVYDKLIVAPKAMGKTPLTKEQIEQFIVELVVERGDFLPQNYHPFNKNCLDFSDALLKILIGQPLPQDVRKIVDGYSYVARSMVKMYNLAMRFATGPLGSPLLGPHTWKFASASMATSASVCASYQIYNARVASHTRDMSILNARRYFAGDIRLPYRIFAGTCLIIFEWRQNGRPLLKIATPLSCAEFDLIRVFEHWRNFDLKAIFRNFNYSGNLSRNNLLHFQASNSVVRLTPDIEQLTQLFSALMTLRGVIFTQMGSQ